MKRNRKPYTTALKPSAVLMILALLWLTISAPFVFASQQEFAKQEKTSQGGTPLTSNEEESANPFGNNTEEKSSLGATFSEDFLPHHYIDDYFFSYILRCHKCKNTGTYQAYHGELLIPPPNVA